ncbi:MAG: hypothetical protein CMN92_02165 [Synechococcus sp. CPC100]|nr:hypothetical protein [Synechococcus sp. CPC100]
MTDTTTHFGDGGFNRDGSNVQKQLAEKPNTMLSRLHVADISSAVIRGTKATGRDDLVDTFTSRRGGKQSVVQACLLDLTCNP